MKITYFYSLYGELDEKLYTRIPLGYYVYILNVSGSDVCKIGIALNVFDRIKQIRSIIKSIFPFIENSIAYNVYISSPLKDDSCRRSLESKLHRIFEEDNLDGEWFKCDFKTVINTLRENEYDYIDQNSFKYILNLFDDNVYNTKMAIKNFERLNYLKSFNELNFLMFIESNYPEIIDPNKFIRIDLNPSITERDLIKILENFKKYIESVPGKSTYKKDVNKRINNFISKFQICKY